MLMASSSRPARWPEAGIWETRVDVDFLSKRMFEIKYKACQFLDPIEPYHYILKYKATVCEISLDDGET